MHCWCNALSWCSLNLSTQMGFLCFASLSPTHHWAEEAAQCCAPWPVRIPVLAHGLSRTCVVISYSPGLNQKLFGAPGRSKNWFYWYSIAPCERLFRPAGAFAFFRPVHLLNTHIHTCMYNNIELISLRIYTKHTDKHSKFPCRCSFTELAWDGTVN